MPDDHPVYKVKSNGFEFTLDKKNIGAADLIKKSPTEFNLLYEHRSVNAVLHESNESGKHVKLELDGEIYDVEIKDEMDQVLDQMGFSSVSNKHIKEIKAPMPGMVLSVAVTEGQEVQDGDRLLILVAMKMENSILINTRATIKKINVLAGQAVEKGQVLMELD